MYQFLFFIVALMDSLNLGLFIFSRVHVVYFCCTHASTDCIENDFQHNWSALHGAPSLLHEENPLYGEDTGYYVATDVKPTTAPEHLSKFDPALWPVYCYVWLKGVGVQTEAAQEFFLLRQLGEDEARSADKLLGGF